MRLNAHRIYLASRSFQILGHRESLVWTTVLNLNLGLSVPLIRAVRLVFFADLALATHGHRFTYFVTHLDFDGPCLLTFICTFDLRHPYLISWLVCGAPLSVTHDVLFRSGPVTHLGTPFCTPLVHMHARCSDLWLVPVMALALGLRSVLLFMLLWSADWWSWTTDAWSHLDLTLRFSYVVIVSIGPISCISLVCDPVGIDSTMVGSSNSDLFS